MKIIGVTSCSTGIAHTYMAAESIKKAAKKLNYTVKVETQGSIGIENRLTAKEIEEADLVIFAADLPVRDVERFSKRKIYECATEDFIRNSDKALQAAITWLNNQ